LHRWIEYPALGTPFGDTLFDRPRAATTVWTPAVELTENDGELRLTVELPGLHKEDVDLSLDDCILTVRGVKRFEREGERGHLRLWERAYGSFERSFQIPGDVEPSEIEARFDNGVLEVRVPKPTGPSAGHSIAIQ